MPIKKRKIKSVSKFEIDSSDDETTYNENIKAKKIKRNSSKLEIIQSSSDGDLLQPKKNGLSTTTTKKYSTVPDKNAGKQMLNSMSTLAEKDPAFYNFLKNEDQGLLNFKVDEASDSDDSIDDEIDNNKNDSGSEFDVSSDDCDEVHKPPNKLEVASDDSGATDDSEDEPDSEAKIVSKEKGIINIDMKLISKWSASLNSKATIATCQAIMSAFQAAVTHTQGRAIEKKEKDDQPRSKYRVAGAHIFNGVVRLCMIDLLPAIESCLRLPEKNCGKTKPIQPSSSKQWNKLKSSIKTYLKDLLRLITQLTEPSVVSCVLKHIQLIVPFLICFPGIVSTFNKRMISFWSISQETTRVLAFLIITRLLRLTQNRSLETCIKLMYAAYVRNTKFTSPSSLAQIGFMQKSLVEIFSLDSTLTYQYSFIYIRQLAIHLRNAITNTKEETQAAVYNWQYIHSLSLWTRMLSQLHFVEPLKPLVYPLTQTIIGTLKLIPTARYYPVRFHCIHMLNILSKNTDTFIPVLPFLLEVLEQTDFNKKHKSANFKPMSFACILKLSKSQLEEKSFKDTVMDQLYEHFMDHFEIYSHTVGFPELALPSTIQMKKFTKNCKNSSYTKLIKQVMERVSETCHVIEKRRRQASFVLSDSAAVAEWENKSLDADNPLKSYHRRWRKIRDEELQLEIAQEQKKETKMTKQEKRKATKQEKAEFPELFEDESKKGKKKEKLMSGFTAAELAKLAESASENDSDGDNSNDEIKEELMEYDSNPEDGGDIVKDFNFSDSE